MSVSVPPRACRRQHGSRSMHMYIKSDLHHSCAALHQAGSSDMGLALIRCVQKRRSQAAMID